MLNGSEIPKMASITVQPDFQKSLYTVGMGENRRHLAHWVDWINAVVKITCRREGGCSLPARLDLSGRTARNVW